MLDYMYLGLYKSVKFFLKILPDALLRKVMFPLAWLAYSVSAKQRKRIQTHLELAFPSTLSEKEKKEIGIQAFMNLIDTVFGIIKRDGMPKEKVLKNIIFEGSEIIKKYQDEGRNFILVTGHFGNWELLSQSIAIKFNLELVGVGRKLDSTLMDEVLKKNREQFNVEMVYKKGALKDSIKMIREGKVMGILIDQALRKNQSVEVDFFNHKATHTPLASILSRKFNLDMIPAFISTKDYEHYIVKVYDPIVSLKTDNQEEDLSMLTQQQADIMERVIKDNPKQWFWMHKRWKSYNKY